MTVETYRKVPMGAVSAPQNWQNLEILDTGQTWVENAVKFWTIGNRKMREALIKIEQGREAWLEQKMMWIDHFWTL